MSPPPWTLQFTLIAVYRISLMEVGSTNNAFCCLVLPSATCAAADAAITKTRRWPRDSYVISVVIDEDLRRPIIQAVASSRPSLCLVTKCVCSRANCFHAGHSERSDHRCGARNHQPTNAMRGKKASISARDVNQQGRPAAHLQTARRNSRGAAMTHVFGLKRDQ